MTFFSLSPAIDWIEHRENLIRPLVRKRSVDSLSLLSFIGSLLLIILIQCRHYVSPLRRTNASGRQAGSSRSILEVHTGENDSFRLSLTISKKKRLNCVRISAIRSVGGHLVKKKKFEIDSHHVFPLRFPPRKKLKIVSVYAQVNGCLCLIVLRTRMKRKLFSTRIVPSVVDWKNAI